MVQDSSTLDVVLNGVVRTMARHPQEEALHAHSVSSVLGPMAMGDSLCIVGHVQCIWVDLVDEFALFASF